MNLEENIQSYFNELAHILANISAGDVAKLVDLLNKACSRGSRVYIFGNGGSAATAAHFASDLSKGAICPGKPGVKAFCLTDNTALVTAWANDTDYANIFAEQLKNYIEPGDVAIGISGSGNSINVLNGIKVARDNKAVTVGFIGFGGGKLKELVDIAIIVPSNNMEQIEDIHLALEHVITTCIRER